MSDELHDIDATAIDELSRLNDEQQALDDRLARLEDEKANVSEAVYERVRRDYAARLAELDDKARPLKDEARAQYRKLEALRQEAGQDLDKARLEKEELELRHRLGEFDDETFQERAAARDQEIETRQTRLAEIEALAERFAGAFRSPAELMAPEEVTPLPVEALPPLPPVPTVEETPEPEAPEARDADVPEADATRLEPEDETVLSGPTPRASPADTAPVETAPALPLPPPIDSQATVLLKGPRLVIHRGDGFEELRLGPQPISIGRAVKNDVRFLSTSVSRHHARVSPSAEGYLVRDLGSGNGTLVNGEPVTGERLLREGDMIQTGSEVLVYRER